MIGRFASWLARKIFGDSGSGSKTPPPPDPRSSVSATSDDETEEARPTDPGERDGVDTDDGGPKREVAPRYEDEASEEGEISKALDEAAAALTGQPAGKRMTAPADPKAGAGAPKEKAKQKREPVEVDEPLEDDPTDTSMAEPTEVPVTVKGVTFERPFKALLLVNEGDNATFKEKGIKGVGAKAILKNRPFESIEALGSTSGIGKKTLEAIRDA